MAGLLRRYKSPLYGNYRKYVVLLGALTGAVLTASVLFLWMVALPISAPESYVTELLLAVCIFVGSYWYREHQTGGKIFLKELLILGVGMGLVGGLVYGIGLMLYGAVVDLDFVDRCIDAWIDAIEASGSETAKAAIEATKGYALGDWAFIGGFRTFVFSIIITFFSAIVFRTEASVRR